MHPVRDIDAFLLLATTLSSKRRPAQLVDIVAAVQLTQGSMPPEEKLREAFARLLAHGLISEQEGGFTLTPEAQQIMAAQDRKGDTEVRVFNIKEALAAHHAGGDLAAPAPSLEQLRAAVAAFRASAKGTGRNLLMPRAKRVERNFKRGGQWRKPEPKKYGRKR